MSGRFEGRRAIVTGAASGIGAAIAEALVEEGATVIGADLAAPAGGPRIEQLDVSDEPGVTALVSALGRERVDALFNVAGVGSTTTAPDTSLDVWERNMTVNARGTFLMCKHVIPLMAAAGGGAIVNMGSVAGLIGLRNRAAYCASKGAVVALTRALAVDHVTEGIRVNCLCPGTVDSPWVRRLVEDSGESLDDLRARQPMGRLGTPQEIAAAATYLASDDAAFVTGSVWTIDGGLTAG